MFGENEGLESEGKDSFKNLRLGVIRKVNSGLNENETNVDSPTYGTVEVEWRDGRLNTAQRIPIVYPAAGDGWGIFSLPEVNDIVVAAFRPGGYPMVLGYIKANTLKQTGQVSFDKKGVGTLVLGSDGQSVPLKPDGFIPIRPLIPGEILLRSREFSEVYFDKNGSLHLSASEKRVGDSKSLTAKLIEVIIGKVFGDDLKTEVKMGDNSVHAQIKHKAGSKLQMDEKGNVEATLTGPGADDAGFIAALKGAFHLTTRSLLALKTAYFDMDADGNIVMENSGHQFVLGNKTGEETFKYYHKKKGAVIQVTKDGDIAIVDGKGNSLIFDAAEGSVSVVNVHGTNVLIQDQIELATKNGANIIVSDKEVQMCGKDGSAVIIDSQDNSVTILGGSVNIQGGTVVLGDALLQQPLVMKGFLDLFYNTHTHVSGIPGNPTSPPVIPMLPVPPPGVVTKQVIGG